MHKCSKKSNNQKNPARNYQSPRRRSIGNFGRTPFSNFLHREKHTNHYATAPTSYVAQLKVRDETKVAENVQNGRAIGFLNKNASPISKVGNYPTPKQCLGA